MTRKNFGAKHYCYPQNVFLIATYDENDNPDVMNAAWGGISDYTQIMLCLSESHKTVKNLKKTGAFTVSMGDAKNVVGCDYVGIVSGNKVDNKVKKAGFTVTKSTLVNAPIINELAVCLECRVQSYSDETEILLGEIVNVSVDESCLTDGKVDISKVQPIIFDAFNNTYHVVGEKVGNAFSDGKKLM